MLIIGSVKWSKFVAQLLFYNYLPTYLHDLNMFSNPNLLKSELF